MVWDVHGLALREDLEERVVSLGDVAVHEALIREAAVALVAHERVRQLVVRLVLSERIAQHEQHASQDLVVIPYPYC